MPGALQRARGSYAPAIADLDRAPAILNAGDTITIYGGSGCRRAREDVIAVVERLKAAIAHTPRAKDILE
jgi:pyruvate dehydrogenase (quinone)